MKQFQTISLGCRPRLMFAYIARSAGVHNTERGSMAIGLGMLGFTWPNHYGQDCRSTSRLGCTWSCSHIQIRKGVLMLHSKFAPEIKSPHNVGNWNTVWTYTGPHSIFGQWWRIAFPEQGNVHRVTTTQSCMCIGEGNTLLKYNWDEWSI